MRTKRGLILALITILLCACLMPATAEVQRQTIRVGYFPFEGYHSIAADGSKSGYGYEYLQEIAKYTGWKYDYATETNFPECLAMLKSGELDLLTSVSYTPERAEYLDFSDTSIGISSCILTVRYYETRYAYGDYASMNGMRVGLLKNSSVNPNFAAFAAENGFTYEADESFTTLKALKQALTEGRVDAIVTNDLRYLEQERIVAEFSPEPFYAAVRKGNTALLKQLNNAIDTIRIHRPNYEMELYNKYYSAHNNGAIALTQNEIAYITANPNIEFSVMPIAEPLSYEESGAWKGISADIVDLLLQKAGFTGTYRMQNSYQTYSNEIGDTAQAIPSMFNNAYYAESHDLRMTTPYLTVHFCTLSLRGTNEIKTIASIRDSTVTHAYAVEHFAPENILYCDSAMEAIEAVRTGKADITLIDNYSAEAVAENDLRHTYVTRYIPGLEYGLCVAVRGEEDPRLFSILNKCVDALSEEDINTVLQRYTAIQHSRTYNLFELIYANPLAAITGILIIVTLLVLVGIMIARTRRRNKELALTRESARFGAMAANAYGEIHELNFEQRVFIRYRFEGDALVKEISPMDFGHDNTFLIGGECLPDDSSLCQTVLSEPALEQMAGTKRSMEYEFRVRCAGDADFHWYSFMLRGIPKDDLHPQSMLLFRRDIDKVRREEEQKKEQLLTALNTAEIASRAKSDFLSRMSHEIRTPLNAIQGFITIARFNKGNPDRVFDCLDKTEFASRHLLSIINDVLDMSAIENGKLTLKPEPFELKQLLSSVCTLFYQQAKAKEILFETYLRDISCENLIGDVTRLNQILINLLSNAIKFTPRGGRVEMTVTGRLIREDKLYLSISVTDTGIGMSEEFTHRLGNPFEKDEISANRYGGTGLGLSITRNLVLLMGGTFNFTSRKGEGSMFSVELPLDIDYGAESATRQFSDVCALVLDPQKESGEATGHTLAHFGVQTTLATTKEQAIEKMTARLKDGIPPYGLCVVDCGFGEEAAREMVYTLREVCRTASRSPYFVFTSYDLAEAASARDDCNAVGALSKPLFPFSLPELLQSLFGEANARKDPVEKLLRFGHKRVLLAEDNDLNMEIASEILKQTGLEVTPVENGLEALDAFRDTPQGTFDAILMDIQMPVMNGYEATRAIRSLARDDAARIPIIAMTANAFIEDVSNALAAGMNDHIAKPIDIDRLMETLTTYLGVTHENKPE